MSSYKTIFYFVFLPQLLVAGPEDTTVWKPFSLLGQKSELSLGAASLNLPVQTGGSMAELLNNNSALFVKMYSPNGLASTSLRGMGAQHTAVLWNGINLQSAMNSNLDLNLLPVFFIDQATLETAGNSATCGSGAIGGALVLNNKLRKERSVLLDVSGGSFSKQSSAIAFNYTYKKWSSTSRVIYRSAENDFPFNNYFKAGKPLERMSNNRFQQKGVMQELGYDFSKRHSLYLNFWHIETERELAAALGASLDSKEKQSDRNTMALLKHVLTLNKNIKVENKLAYLSEGINYYNINYPTARNKAQMLIAESNWRLFLKRQFELYVSLNETIQQAKSLDGYAEGVERYLTAAFIRLKWESLNHKLGFSAGNRFLIHDQQAAPMSPELAAEWQFHKFLKLKSNAAYSYRLPSFNDLYWNPGGNVDLLPEKSRKAELSLDYQQGGLNLLATVFKNQVKHWIMWQPVQGSFNWKALNVMEVESQGLELAAEFKFQIAARHALTWRSRYQYVESVQTASYQSDRRLLGKQLFYTPWHSGFMTLVYGFKQYKFNYNATYTGTRFSSADNNPDSELAAYFISNISCSRDWHYKKLDAQLEFSVFNAGNVAYTVVENRPMPLRNYQIKLKFNINYE